MGRTATYRWVRATYYELKQERDWADAERFVRETSKEGQTPEVWAEQKRWFVAAARARGARVAVFLSPYESQVYVDARDDTPIDLMRELCAGLEVPLVDLAERFRTSPTRPTRRGCSSAVTDTTRPAMATASSPRASSTS
ncbi:MAG: hypothetical protein AAF682_24580 [Planctomycetota bacterium]